MDRRRRLLTIAFVLALCARLLFALGYWVEKPLTLDEQEYLTLARNLASGHGLVYDADGRDHFGRPPGYPALLAVIFTAGGGTRAYKVVQSLIGALAVLVIAALARLAAGPRAEIVAAFIAALYPPLVWICGYALSEALYSGLALCAAWLLWKALERERGSSPPRGTLYLLTGAVTGVSTLVRAAGVPYLALVVAYLGLRRSIPAAAWFLIGAALAVVPWTLFKTRQADRPVLIASDGGVTFWTGNNPLAIGEGDMAANPRIREANQRLLAANPGLGPDQLEPIYYAEAKKFILGDPLHWMALNIRKLFYLWVPIGPSYRLHSGRYYGATLVSYLGILPFAAAGFWRLAREHALAAPLWLLGGSVVLTCLVFSPQDRFRIPVLDPVLIICASATLARIGTRRRA